MTDAERAIGSSVRASASGTAVPQNPHSALIRPMNQFEWPQPGQWFAAFAGVDFKVTVTVAQRATAGVAQGRTRLVHAGFQILA